MPRYEYSDEIVNVIKKFLIDDDWHYSFNEDTGFLDLDSKSGVSFKTSAM